jgi:hypothetical protein
VGRDEGALNIARTREEKARNAVSVGCVGVSELSSEAVSRSRIARFADSWRRPVHRDGLALVSSSALSSLVGLLYWVVAAQLFPAAEVGVGSALVSTLMLLGSVGHLNLGVALLRFVPVSGGQCRALVVGCYLTGAAAAATVGTVFALGAGWWAPDLLAAAGPGGLVAFLAVGAAAWRCSSCRTTCSPRWAGLVGLPAATAVLVFGGTWVLAPRFGLVGVGPPC